MGSVQAVEQREKNARTLRPHDNALSGEGRVFDAGRRCSEMLPGWGAGRDARQPGPVAIVEKKAEAGPRSTKYRKTEYATVAAGGLEKKKAKNKAQ